MTPTVNGDSIRPRCDVASDSSCLETKCEWRWLNLHIYDLADQL